jgi:hypothetical protein
LVGEAILNGDLFRLPSPPPGNGFVAPQFGFIGKRFAKHAANRTRGVRTEATNARHDGKSGDLGKSNFLIL